MRVWNWILLILFFSILWLYYTCNVCALSKIQNTNGNCKENNVLQQGRQSIFLVSANCWCKTGTCFLLLFFASLKCLFFLRKLLHIFNKILTITATMFKLQRGKDMILLSARSLFAGPTITQHQCPWRII